MKHFFLEVTHRHGRPFAAYYYLPRDSGETSTSTRRVEAGMVVDYNARGLAIGIEITAPAALTLDEFNRVLAELGFAPVESADLAPLHAA